ncbi:MAG TPA: glutamate formimidoyltransferase [Candidatus Poseidoniales archaeon]|nr:MAG TPA: glutamate formimidoyltransferase [Candidatus Poseidoniales archaeon]
MAYGVPMSEPLVACIPNISEGQDASIIDAICDAASGIDGCALIGSEPDPDYNRTVITLAGRPDSVREAAFRLIAAAAELIDMRVHTGNHPRMGAVDVCPFVPIKNADAALCEELAASLGSKVDAELSLPVFYYGSAASHPDRTALSALRRGEYESLEERMTGEVEASITRDPDYGSGWNVRHARFGAVAIGVRPILVAYNVNLAESDAAVAKKVGTIVRSSGRLIRNGDERMRVSGMLEKVQGMGVPLEAHGISQVSMNLQDVGVTDMHQAFEAVKSLASDHGVDVDGSELVGLAPLSSFLAAGRWYSPNEAEEAALIEAAVQGLGLDRLGLFNPNERIIEYAVEAALQ